MKKYFFSLFFLALAALACNFGGNTASENIADDQPYSTDFSGNTSDWETTHYPDDSLREVQDGMYRIFVNRDGGMVSVLGYERFRYSGDVQIEVEVSRVEGPASSLFGILCRYTLTGEDQADFYALHISPTGFGEIFKISNGNYKSLGHQDVNFNKNATNTLRAECVGDTLTLYVNGEEIISVKDNELKGGYVGLLVTGKGSDVYFDNFSVTVP